MRIYKLILIVVAALFVNVSAQRASSKINEAKQLEYETLKNYLNDARDSLQKEIADRWRIKQRYVEQRELDKEELSRLRETQERAFSDLSRAKEELFSRERIVEEQRKDLILKKDAWELVSSALTDAFEKESKYIEETNPLDMEKRRALFEVVRREFNNTRNPARILMRYISYHSGFLSKENSIGTFKQNVMPDEGDPKNMTIVRFGDVFAYALSDDGNAYILRQTGSLGAARFKIEQVSAQNFAIFLQENIPLWLNSGKISGNIMADVMQNANSSLLISGKKVSHWTDFKQWVKAGGSIMIPLFLILLWAIFLVIVKLFQYKGKHKYIKDFYENVAGMLKAGEHEKALEYASKSQGVVARIVKTCLKHSKWTRSSAEKAVREILVEESPQLNKYLSTLAVIAAAAPMLGLLGTVTGMISLFEVITHYGTSDPKILAGGISEALITTQMGLSVAIPILLIHNYLRNQSMHIHSEMEKHAIKVLNRLWPEN
jgi:biopolymer transport protein ExbB